MFLWFSLTLLFLITGVWGLILLNAFDITFHLAEAVNIIEEIFEFRDN